MAPSFVENACAPTVRARNTLQSAASTLRTFATNMAQHAGSSHCYDANAKLGIDLKSLPSISTGVSTVTSVDVIDYSGYGGLFHTSIRRLP